MWYIVSVSMQSSVSLSRKVYCLLVFGDESETNNHHHCYNKLLIFKRQPNIKNSIINYVSVEMIIVYLFAGIKSDESIL